jgi:type II secretory pathway pseudopilin PulG
MGGSSSASARRGFRRAHRLRSHQRGVVAVIGTLLALLVFFALFGIFLTQYVPLWMTDNEAAYTASAQASFAQLKSAMDAQYVLGGPQSYGTPVVISSDGIPLLAQPTQGSLEFLPQSCPAPASKTYTYPSGFYTKGATGATAANYGQPVNPAACTFANFTESIGPGGSGTYSQAVMTGVLQFSLPNRYYSAQTFYLEDDAVIQSQGGGNSVMTVPPPINITRVGGNTTVWGSLLQLYGNSSSVIGTGTEPVYTNLRFTQLVTSNGALSASTGTFTPFTFDFEIGTQYPCAWGSYFNNLLYNQSGLPTSSFTLTSGLYSSAATVTYFQTQGLTCTNSVGATSVLTVTISHVNYAAVYVAGIQVGIGVGAS